MFDATLIFQTILPFYEFSRTDTKCMPCVSVCYSYMFLPIFRLQKHHHVSRTTTHPHCQLQFSHPPHHHPLTDCCIVTCYIPAKHIKKNIKEGPKKNRKKGLVVEVAIYYSNYSRLRLTLSGYTVSAKHISLDSSSFHSLLHLRYFHFSSLL